MELENHHFSVSLSCELASFFWKRNAFPTFKCSCRQKGRNLVCGVENEDFYVFFCFVHLSVVLNFSLFVNKLENSSLCELSIQTGVCFVELGNDHFRHLSVHDQEECYKLEECLLMSDMVHCETLEEYLSSLLKSCASCKIIVEYLSTLLYDTRRRGEQLYNWRIPRRHAVKRIFWSPELKHRLASCRSTPPGLWRCRGKLSESVDLSNTQQK